MGRDCSFSICEPSNPSESSHRIYHSQSSFMILGGSPGEFVGRPNTAAQSFYEVIFFVLTFLGDSLSLSQVFWEGVTNDRDGFREYTLNNLAVQRVDATISDSDLLQLLCG